MNIYKIKQKSKLVEVVIVTKKIKIAIAGLGNCASSLIQGINYYKYVDEKHDLIPGLMHNSIQGYFPSSIEPVVAFDIDIRKVGKPIEEAMFAHPNCTLVFQKEIHEGLGKGVPVLRGPTLDGIAKNMDKFPGNKHFVESKEEPVDVAKALKDSGAEVLVNYMPVGSEKATKHYADACLKAGVAMVNCMPVFIASHPEYANKFKKANLPVVGDDIKSQVGATITHRVMADLWAQRGVKLLETYQLNVGGNTDFLNMHAEGEARLKSKRVSKTSSVLSQIPHDLPDTHIHVGPSDFVPFLNDQKRCFIYMKGQKFGGAPVVFHGYLEVEDSPNSGGVSIDAIRCCKLAIDRKISGPLTSIASYTMKHPPIQYRDVEARRNTELFIEGKLER